MKIDHHNVLVIEKDGPPGDLGDSVHETSRYSVLRRYVFGTLSELSLDVFRTDTGYIRHPDVPESWRENDFSSDAALVYIQAVALNRPDLLLEALQRLMFVTTPDKKKRSSLGVMFLCLGMLRTLNVVNAVQGLLFKLPYRFGDGGKLESNVDSSADYLNWLVTACFLDVVNVKPYLTVDAVTVRSKIHSYYSNQRNVDEILRLYDLAISKVYGGST